MSRILFIALVPVFVLVSMAPSEAQQVFPEGLSSDQVVKLQNVLEASSLEDFVVATRGFWKNERQGWNEDTKDEVRAILGNESKSRLFSGAPLSSIDSGLLYESIGWASHVITDSEKDQLGRDVEEAFGGGAGRTFEELQAETILLGGLYSHDAQRQQTLRNAIEDWLLAQDLSSLPASQLDWCFRTLCPDNLAPGGFEVTWTGFITAPRSGQYTFSVSPWNVNWEVEEDGDTNLHQQEMSVHVGEREVVKATPESWEHEGTPVALVEKEVVPIRVEFRYETNETHRLCPVILYWQGPGIRHRVVPSSAFSHEGGAGLNAIYEWENDSERVVRQLVDPNVEFIWFDNLVVGARTEALKKLADAFVANWSRPESDFIGDVVRRPSKVAMLSCAQLETCLESLLAEPERLQGISLSNILRFYSAVRCGAEEAATDVLGLWMTHHKDIEPEFAKNAFYFQWLNRHVYRRLVEYLTYENPPLLKLLEERYLVADDGSCCLPVAYVLSESYYLQDRIHDWIETLDDRLSNGSLSGDKRVNWLIARAAAAEIAHGDGDRRIAVIPNLHLSRSWIDESRLIAEGESTQLRVLKEHVTRLAATGKIEQALEAIDSKVSSLKDPSITSQLDGWRESIRSIALEIEQDLKDFERSGQEALRALWEAQRNKASEQGLGNVAEQYQTLIDSLPDE